MYSFDEYTSNPNGESASFWVNGTLAYSAVVIVANMEVLFWST